MRSSLLLAILVMGLTSIIVEVVLVRELLVNFLGNELSVGVILANWLLLEALGSWVLGRISTRIYRQVRFYVGLQVLIAALLPLIVAEARVIRNMVGLVPGEGIGLPSIALLSFFILAPIAFADGAQFTLACRIFSSDPRGSSGITFVYVVEALGSVIGGIAATYLFVPWAPSMITAFTVGIINVSSGLLLLYNYRGSRRILAIVAFAFFALILVSSQAGNIGRITLEDRWKNYELLDSHNSIYGNIAVIRQAGQTTFFVDGVPAVTSPIPDVDLARDLVHIPLLLHGNPRNILVIGGGASGVLSEVLRHDVEGVTYVEQDPLLIRLIGEYPTEITEREFGDPRVRVERTDGRRFLAGTQENFDIVLMNLPYPSSLVLNRFYTAEFFSIVTTRMRPGGILAFPVPGAPGYLSEEERRMNQCLLQALKEAFEHIRVVPGTPNILLASNADALVKGESDILCKRSLSLGMAGIMPCQRIRYLLDANREAWYWESLRGTEVRTNRDLHPSGVFYSLSYWTSIFTPSSLWAIRIIEKIDLFLILAIMGAIGLAMLYFRMRLRFIGLIPLPFVVASTGFFGMGFDIMIILAFQSFFGFLYQEIGLILMAFMLGLVLGGSLAEKKAGGRRRDLIMFEILIIVFCAAFMVVLPNLGRLADSAVFSWASKLLLLGLSGTSGLLVGAEFSVSSRARIAEARDLSKAAGSVYAWDLAGAVVGSLALSIALVPLIGVTGACIFVLAVKVVSISLLIAP